jgi:hypothetical protein
MKLGNLLPPGIVNGVLASLLLRYGDPTQTFEGMGMKFEGSGVSPFGWFHPIQQVPARLG